MLFHIPVCCNTVVTFAIASSRYVIIAAKHRTEEYGEDASLIKIETIKTFIGSKYLHIFFWQGSKYLDTCQCIPVELVVVYVLLCNSSTRIMAEKNKGIYFAVKKIQTVPMSHFNLQY